jgi:hypothetical protein
VALGPNASKELLGAITGVLCSFIKLPILLIRGCNVAFMLFRSVFSSKFYTVLLFCFVLYDVRSM